MRGAMDPRTTNRPIVPRDRAAVPDHGTGTKISTAKQRNPLTPAMLPDYVRPSAKDTRITS